MNIKTANRLCELRKKNGLSQEELASRLGVSRQAVSKWERSESSPDTDNLIELAKIYNMSLDELLNGDEAIDIIEENKEADRDSIKSEDSIILTDDNGESVEIKEDRIIAYKKDGTVEELDKEAIKNKLLPNPIISTITGLSFVLAAVVYLILGFVLPDRAGWHYWFLFIAAPVIPSIVKCFINKRICEFNYPFTVTAIFCALGVFLDLWHPLWVLFITIPVFYIIGDTIDKYVFKTAKIDK